MVKRRIQWFEAKATLECVVCDKDIEVGDHYCLNDTGEPMHYYCYDVSTSSKADETANETNSKEEETAWHSRYLNRK